MFTRRQLLGGAAAATMVTIAGCSTSPGSPVTPPASTAGLPAHVPFTGVTPDLPGDPATGVPAAFFSYPDPVDTGRTPLNLSAPVTMMLPGAAPTVGRSEDRWLQLLEQEAGTTLDLQITATNYLDKFNVALAGNKLPEVALFLPIAQLDTMLDRMYTDLTPFLGGDAVKKYPNLANVSTPVWEVCKVNGRIWGVSEARNPAGMLMMTNGAVLATKGIDPMVPLTNGEDFLAVCREVTDRGKGIFALGQDAVSGILPVLLESLGGPNQWRVDGDRFVSMYETEEYAASLDIAAGLWREGLCHPNSYTEGSASAVPHGWFENGTTAFLTQTFASWGVKSAALTHPVGAVVWPMWHGGGKARKHLGLPGYSGIVGIRKTADAGRVDEILRLFDYLASPFGTQQFLNVNHGVAGVQYTLQGGQITPIPKAPRMGGLSYVGSQRVRDLYVPGKPDLTRQLHAYCKDMIPAGTQDPSLGLFSETQLSKGASALRTLHSAAAAIVRGQAPHSSWRTAVDEWNRAAGTKIAEELQSARQAR